MQSVRLLTFAMFLFTAGAGSIERLLLGVRPSGSAYVPPKYPDAKGVPVMRRGMKDEWFHRPQNRMHVHLWKLQQQMGECLRLPLL